MSDDAKWEGVDEAMAALQAVNAKLAGGAVKSFTRKTVKDVVVPSVISAIHSKRAKSSIKIKAARGSKTATVTGPTYHPERWLQGGTVKRANKAGANRGSIRGNNTLEAKYDSLVNPVIDYTVKNMKKEITRTLNNKLRATNRKISKL